MKGAVPGGGFESHKLDVGMDAIQEKVLIKGGFRKVVEVALAIGGLRQAIRKAIAELGDQGIPMLAMGRLGLMPFAR